MTIRGPAVVICADWSKDPRCRAVYVAEIGKARVSKVEPNGLWSVQQTLALAEKFAGLGQVVLGFDAPLGVPRSFWDLLRRESAWAHCRSFADWVRVAPGASSRWADPAPKPADWAVDRPFFAVPAGTGSRRRWERALRVRGVQLLRAVDRRTGAKPGFVTSGIPGAVGSSARDIWQGLARAHRDGRRFSIRPFEDPAEPGAPIVAEIYPRAAYAVALSGEPPDRRAPLVVAKTRRAVRQAALDRLLSAQWVRALGVDISDADAATASEDDFDALIAAAALLRCVLEGTPLSDPTFEDPVAEGGILGTGSVNLRTPGRAFKAGPPGDGASMAARRTHVSSGGKSMGKDRADRRDFLKTSLAGAAGVGLMRPSGRAGAAVRVEAPQGSATPAKPGRIRFAAIGLNHGHINGQTEALIRGGGELVSFFAKEDDLADAYAKRFPQARRARSESEILEDPKIQLVASASIPNERAPLGVRVMRHGKDFMVDKPGITSLEQLAEVRRVQAETRRIYSITYSERFENRATVKAAELVEAGAIGRVVQTIGLGPHRLNASSRPAWFFERERYGGILCDIASHQFDQFLFFTGSTRAEVVASQVANVHHPQYPGLEDFGDVTLRGNRGSGYIRVDWFTPDGLNTWGDGRLTVLGTDGFIEIRKNVDIAGRPGGSHLFLVDQKETRYLDCSEVPLPYGPRLVDDVLNRTETAMSQVHCLLAMELALRAQQQATRLSFDAPSA